MVTSGVRSSHTRTAEWIAVNALAPCARRSAIGQGDAEGWCGTTSFRLVRVADPAHFYSLSLSFSLSLFLFSCLSFRRSKYLVDIRTRGKSSCDSQPDMRHGGFLDDWAKCTVPIDDVGRRSPFCTADLSRAINYSERAVTLHRPSVLCHHRQ